MNVEWGHGRGACAVVEDELLAGDPAFRDRADALHGARVRDALAAAFPALRGARLEPDGVGYVPRRTLQVVYRARDLEGHAPVLVRVRFLPSTDSAPAPLATEAHAGAFLPRLRAVAWAFPDDPELPALREVVAGRWAAEHLGAAGRWTPLSYLPGRRCALRHERPGGEVVVVRVQPPGDAAVNAARARAAWAAPSRRFRMAEPLGHDPATGAVWERFLAGERLDALLGGGRLAAAADGIVEAVVGLHALRLPDLPREGPGELLRRTAKVARKARAALPGLGPALDALERRLGAAAGLLREGPAVTLHGDLHTANLLVGAEGVAFIDLDRMSSGSPAADLALLGSRLLLVALHAGGRVEETARIVAALPERYARAGGHAIAAETFAWYVAAALVGRQVKTVVRHLAPGAARLAATLLGWAGRTLEQGAFDASVVRLDGEEVDDAREAAHAA